MEDNVLTTSQAAKLLGISVRTAQLLIEAGSLPSWKTPGGHRRVYRAEVQALLARSQTAQTLESVVVMVVASEKRQPRFESALSAAGDLQIEMRADIWSAMLELGALSPAAVIIDVADDTAPRLAMLARLADDARLGDTQLILVKATAQKLAADLVPARVRVATLRELPTLLQDVVEDAGDIPDLESPGSYPVAPNEGRRLRAVERSGLIDTGPDAAFDRVTWLAAQTLGTPIALMTLITPTRQWFKSRRGIELTESPRSLAICNHTILQRNVFMVSDLSTNPTFATSPVVTGAPFFRFYAGAPVIDPEGFALGSICVMDYKPRTLDAAQRQVLQALAAIASNEVRMLQMDRELRRTREQLQRKERTGR